MRLGGQIAYRADPLPRLPEDRLSHLLGRVSHGSYTPHSPGHPCHPGQPGAVLGQANYGASDDLGYCLNRQHTPGCSSMASTTEAAETIRPALRQSAYEPLADDRGVPWTDQHGGPLTLLGAVEAAAGVRRTRESPFEGRARRELTAPARRMTIRDLDDPGSPGLPVPGQTRASAAAVAAYAGITPPDMAARRQQARAQRERVLAAQQLARGGRRVLGVGETMRERAERKRAENPLHLGPGRRRCPRLGPAVRQGLTRAAGQSPAARIPAPPGKPRDGVPSAATGELRSRRDRPGQGGVWEDVLPGGLDSRRPEPPADPADAREAVRHQLGIGARRVRHQPGRPDGQRAAGGVGLGA
jgi:hypothetical protein